MSEANSPPDEACSAIERLYDDPDAKIDALQARRPPEDEIAGQEGVFKALGNADRLRVLWALRESELCGCELQVVLDAPQSTVATHVRKLKEAGLVKSRKRGRWSYYRIADTAVFELLDLAAAVEGEA